jgi:A/G-specific adenine glycosylase
MPWRAPAGEKANPYYVWLSEIMLQQTTVAAVIPYFLKFIRRWPTLHDLADASLDDINRMWAGLGYYRRARGLHECARVVVRDYDGVFPQDEHSLLALPGVGPYTAAAIAAIAFGQKANVVDGNVERVMARLYAVREPLPKAKKELKTLAAALVPAQRCGDYAQALMDLGATVCTPRSPRCDMCPWRKSCVARENGLAEGLPAREKKRAKPMRYGIVFVLSDKQGRVLLTKRPDKGLLAGMMGLPGPEWQEEPISEPFLYKNAPEKANWELLDGYVHHTFTHFELQLRVARATSRRPLEDRGILWQDCANEALPSVMLKALRFARNGV